MNAVIPETQRIGGMPFAGAAAAVVLLGTNLLATPAEIQELSAAHHSAIIVIDPFSSATTQIALGWHTAAVATESAAQVTARWGKYVAQRLAEIRSGMHDFTGLQIPPSDVIDRSRDVALDTFPPDVPPPSVLPTEDGGVSFVWHKSGWDIEVEVGPEETMVWAHDRKSGEEFSGLLESYRGVTTEVLKTLAAH